MRITKKSILGVGADTSLVNIGWERPSTPNTKDGVRKVIDSVEFEINHRRIEKLKCYIQNRKQYVMCFVHFDKDTENLDGIYMSVWNEDASGEISIDTSILEEKERQVILDYALSELREHREYCM